MAPNAMSADALLLWMSARGSGSWQQFRGAVEDMRLAVDADPRSPVETDSADGLPLYQLLRLNLERIGHAEFFKGAAGADWRIVPPVLAISGTGDDALGVIAGARSPRRLARVRETFGDKLREAVLDGYPTHQVGFAAAPELAAIGKQAGLLVQHDAPLTILLSLPSVDSVLARRSTDLPFGGGWSVERFSTSTLTWKSAVRDEAERVSMGLFRFSFRNERRVLLCTRGDTREVAAQIGKYALLKRAKRKVLTYERATRTIAVPPICRPPLLVERALILSAGVLPAFDPSTGRLVYAGVPEPVARVAAQLLRQDL
jgi:hypothetical protein